MSDTVGKLTSVITKSALGTIVYFETRGLELLRALICRERVTKDCQSVW